MRRIVITSSVAAVMAQLPEPKLFTAEDWNDQAIEAVEKLGKGASGDQKYGASKTLAEKGAPPDAWFWSHLRLTCWRSRLEILRGTQIRGQVGLAHVEPAFGAWRECHPCVAIRSLRDNISKPPIHEVHEPSSLNTSLARWYDVVVAKSQEASANPELNYIDVRDLANAHADALEKEAAGGSRFLVTAGTHKAPLIREAAAAADTNYAAL